MTVADAEDLAQAIAVEVERRLAGRPLPTTMHELFPVVRGAARAVLAEGLR